MSHDSHDRELATLLRQASANLDITGPTLESVARRRRRQTWTTLGLSLAAVAAAGVATAVWLTSGSGGSAQTAETAPPAATSSGSATSAPTAPTASASSELATLPPAVGALTCPSNAPAGSSSFGDVVGVPKSDIVTRARQAARTLLADRYGKLTFERQRVTSGQQDVVVTGNAPGPVATLHFFLDDSAGTWRLATAEHC